MSKRKPKTYDVTRDGKKVRVTVPDREDPAEPAKELRDLLQDCMSPQAVAAIAAYLHGMVKTKDDKVNGEVAWFTEQLLEMLGDQYNALCEEIGL